MRLGQEDDLSVVVLHKLLVFAELATQVHFEVLVVEDYHDVGLECFDCVHDAPVLFVGLGTEGVDEDATGEHLREDWIDVLMRLVLLRHCTLRATEQVIWWLELTRIWRNLALLVKLVINLELHDVVVNLHFTCLSKLSDLRVEEVRGDDELPRSTRTMEVVDGFLCQVVCVTFKHFIYERSRYATGSRYEILAQIKINKKWGPSQPERVINQSLAN